MDYSYNLDILYNSYLIYDYYLLAIHSNECRNIGLGRFNQNLYFQHKNNKMHHKKYLSFVIEIIC